MPKQSRCVVWHDISSASSLGVLQWVPATSMALFVPAGGLPALQYAGQQNPADVAAAATAAAAAAAGQMQPMPGMVPLLPIMMPPILPPPVLAPGTAAGGSLPGAAEAAQQAAAAAAAAAAAVSLMAPGAPVMVPQPVGPGNTQALQQVGHLPVGLVLVGSMSVGKVVRAPQQRDSQSSGSWVAGRWLTLEVMGLWSWGCVLLAG